MTQREEKKGSSFSRVKFKFGRRRIRTPEKEGPVNLETLLNNLPGMVYRCKNDRDWTMEFVSAGCASLTGYHREALINNQAISYGELIHPDDRRMVWDEVQIALKEKRSFQLDYRIVTSEEKEKWVWEQGEGIMGPNGDLTAIEGFITDITPIARYKNLLNNMLEGCQIIDLNWRYKYLNETALKHARRTEKEMIGRTMQELYPGIEDTELFEKLKRVMENRSPNCMKKEPSGIVCENEFEYPDGDKNWYELRIESIPEGLFILSLDIQSRKQLEAERLDRQRVEKDESLRQMGYAVTDHYINYLGAALGYINLSLEEMENSSKISGRIENLRKGQQEAVKALDLNEKLRVYLGGSNGKPEVFDMGDICNKHLSLLRSVIPKEITLSTTLPKSALKIKANPNRIREILSYLVANARESIEEYPGHGEIRVTVEAVKGNRIPKTNRRPVKWESSADTYICLTVKDTGCGMDDGTISRIFDPFFTVVKDACVCGMGLPMILGITRALNGCIAVTSAPKKGSAFKVYLPAEQDIPDATLREDGASPADPYNFLETVTPPSKL